MARWEKVFFPPSGLFAGAAGVPQQRTGGRETLRPVRIEAIESAGLDQALELPPIEAARVEPRREIEQVAEAAVPVALGNEIVHCVLADALDGRECVPDGGLCRFGIVL